MRDIGEVRELEAATRPQIFDHARNRTAHRRPTSMGDMPPDPVLLHSPFTS
jgi:hypothetical protein